MKVLSLKEPYASLIKEKKKTIETRSWKTDYRGELYIHASNSTEKNERLLELIQGKPLSNGNIICKTKLVDCILMDEDFIKIIKENKIEYLCGEYKVGRYAWILEDVQTIEPIKAKGNLNIWNYYKEEEMMEQLNKIEYGWIDKDKKRHTIVDENFSSDYRLQSPKELEKSKLGVCWDQVELERFYLKNTIYPIQTFFIVHYDNDRCPTHTFLIYQKEKQYVWLEHSWEIHQGIHKYPTLEKLLEDVKQKFIKTLTSYQKENLYIYEYKKPPYHIDVVAFYKHCEQGNRIGEK